MLLPMKTLLTNYAFVMCFLALGDTSKYTEPMAVCNMSGLS